MQWTIEFHSDFEPEFYSLTQSVQDELLAHVGLLKQFGPNLSRPHVDTLKGSQFHNMKELRFDANNGVWRIAFAFDQKRRAILLIAGNKKGEKETLFYKQLIKQADKRFSQHIESMKVKED